MNARSTHTIFGGVLLPFLVAGCEQFLGFSLGIQQSDGGGSQYNEPSSVTLTLSSTDPGSESSHQLVFGLTLGELQTYQAVLDYPSDFTFNGFDALGPVNTQIGTIAIEYDFSGNPFNFSFTVRSTDTDNAYADVNADGVYTQGFDPVIVHSGNERITITLPFGGDGSAGTSTAPANGTATVTLMSGLLRNPATDNQYTINGTFTSVDPDSGDADDNQGSNPITFMSSQTVTIGTGGPGGSNDPAKQLTDFNGDGMADILWRHNTTGQNVFWFLNGAALSGSGSILGLTDSSWDVGCTGDFNGNGLGDIFWRHDNTGQNVLWFMNGTTLTASSVVLGVADTNWDIEGCGDFNGDGMTDLLWRHDVTGQNVIWLMNGTAISSSASVPALITSWEVKGVADFSGDGMTDILWHNRSTGQNVVWLMNGTTLTGSGSLPGVPNGWKTVATGDFGGDGMDDILWRHETTGQNVIWNMNGTVLSSSGSTLGLTDTNWWAAGVGTVNADGMADLLWRHATTGQNVIWIMNGTSVQGSGSITSLADQNWRVQ